VCTLPPDVRFSSLGSPGRVWAVSSVHGEISRLLSLHDALLERITPGDRIVYLGNYTGYGTRSAEVVDELLTFRRLALSIPGMKAQDIVYLRGAQEDIWQRLLQIQFAHTPSETLLWMLGNGMGNALSSYGISRHDGLMAAKEGVMALTRWTASIRDTFRRRAGHDIFMTQHRRAAYTGVDGRFPVRFVNAGIDAAKPLEHQGDNLFWHGESFNAIQDAYKPFEKVVRGFDPGHEGVRINCVTASLDGGCGFGGPLVCGGMRVDGEMFELLEA